MNTTNSTDNTPSVASDTRNAVPRRRLLSIGAAAAALGAGAAVGVERAIAAPPSAPAPQDRYPFFGPHQAGITTPVQDRLHFAAFDVEDIGRDGLIGLLKDWTDAAAKMTQGSPAGDYGPASGPYQAPPDDTGEAMDLSAARLTLTFGFGPGLFVDDGGKDRFGLAARRPAALADLPRFKGDQLVPEQSGGDICVQACADDPQVAVHAIRNLSRIAFGRAALRWSQLGFGRTSSTSTSQPTPRNLFGFKDGTANIKSEDSQAVSDHVWAAAADGSAWMAGGSYLVARKIRMTIETWDHTRLSEQETVIGRTKGEGAPLSGGTEFTAPDFSAPGRNGNPLIDRDSHVRLAHPDSNGGAKLLRRGYNFVDGNDQLGRLNGGLFFISYQRDPRKQFVPIQTKLAASDRLNEYIKHVASALFAVPPGVQQGGYIGSGLFA